MCKQQRGKNKLFRILPQPTAITRRLSHFPLSPPLTIHEQDMQKECAGALPICTGGAERYGPIPSLLPLLQPHSRVNRVRERDAQ